MRSSVTLSLRAACLAACMLACPGIGVAGDHNGGKVMQPQRMPYGYSLDAMAKALAIFNTSGNSMNYPATPFQILYVQEFTAVDPITCLNGQQGLGFKGVGFFPVTTGVTLFVPVWNVDDSLPFIAPFPSDRSGAADYFFGASNYGAAGMKITVDGKTTTLGPRYLGGPVTQDNPPLMDGGGTHLIMLGGFVSPLGVGRHTVRIQGEMGNSQLFYDTYGLWCMREDLTYTVRSLPELGN